MGRVPFYGVSDAEVIMSVVFRKQCPSRSKDLEWEQGDAIWELMTSCWDHNPFLRPTAANVLEQIRHLLSSRSGSDDVLDAPGWEGFDIHAIRSSVEYPPLDLDLLNQL
ncbi:hypothetical protein AAF712_014675 [Marasmius tenuissimus]|uniref:Serine-threonine/tyrosine-protein kinase catalytic domain-containing protein n=1 Tax=Marasmius tenuissimus TaxID=585030 RepID=A0ABR2ZCM4_9AGAR